MGVLLVEDASIASTGAQRREHRNMASGAGDGQRAAELPRRNLCSYRSPSVSVLVAGLTCKTGVAVETHRFWVVSWRTSDCLRDSRLPASSTFRSGTERPPSS